MGNTNARQSNLELLRIISMAMIIGLHYFNASMGGAFGKLTPSDYNYYIAYCLESMFFVSVGCYVLITGYCQINKEYMEVNKIIGIYAQVTFYALTIFIIAIIAGITPFNIKTMGGILLLSCMKNWFVKVYIILYILSPFLNLCLNKLDKSAYKKLLVIMLLLFSIWPSFFPDPPVTDNGYGITTFILLYCLGGYIKKHYTGYHSKKYCFSGYIICAFLTFILSLLCPNLFGYIFAYNFIFNIFGAVFIFLFFTKLNIKSKRINYLSSFTFGVFLIHTNFYLRDFIYEKILHCSRFWFSPLFVIHVIVSIAIIYSLSTLIDICRKWLFDRLSKYIVPVIKNFFPILWKKIP